MRETSIGTCQKNKRYEKEISKGKIPQEYWFKWKTKKISKKLLCFKETFYETKSQYSISFSYVDNLILFIMLKTFMRQNLSIQLFFCIMS